MNKTERRIAKREQRRIDFLQSMPSYDEIFTFEHLYESFWLCRKEVSWKPSIQIYQHNLLDELHKTLQILYSEEGFKSRGFIEFDICERGKMRHIRSVDIQERVVQRCFCDYYLVPLLTHNLIYDNGASLKGKGIAFSIERVKQHLRCYYNKYHSNDGYILLYDFSNYFGSINHDKLYEVIDPFILDERCRKLYHHLVDAFGDVGLGLGSQVSQISAVAFPNKIDQHFVHSKNVESYARYMDDGYIITHTKEAAQQAKKELLNLAQELGLTINPKKIKIIKLSTTFIFLKKRFLLRGDGKVVVRLLQKNVYTHRRKMRALVKLAEEGRLNIENVELAHKSWRGQQRKYCNQKAIHNVDLQVRRLINDYRATHPNIPSNKCGISKG